MHIVLFCFYLLLTVFIFGSVRNGRLFIIINLQSVFMANMLPTCLAYIYGRIWQKKIRTVVLFALLFVLHVAVGTSFVIWLESMDNDGTYDGFGDFYRYEQQEPGGNWVLCIQEVYVSGSNPEESKQHNIIYVQTGYNTLKQVRKYKFGPADYEVSWKNDRVQIFQELWNEDKPNHSPYIDIYYDEWKRSGADID